jgi:DNA repair ATPase RecN
MSAEIFFAIYGVLMIVGAIIGGYVLTDDKNSHIKMSIKYLSNLFERNYMNFSAEVIRELKRLYTQFGREYSKFRKFYPNIIMWLDAILFRIDTIKKISPVLLENEALLKEARDILEKENPFYQCSEYQQEILNDIRKFENDDNEIVVKNILNRSREEFLRQNIDNSRNRILNMISVIIGLTGIIVSVIIAVIK